MGQYIIGYDSKTPPPYYDREPEYKAAEMQVMKDVYVPMRDGIHLCADIYWPNTDKPLPVLLAFACHNKELQTPEACENAGAQPSWSSQWYGVQEGGDSRFFTSRGYVHVVAQPRGHGKSEDGGEIYYSLWGAYWDCYDLIEWIAAQPWCDGNVGMVGISAFGASQLHAARTHPPHLKAIFPVDTGACYSNGSVGFHDSYPGGMIHFHLLIGGAPSDHAVNGLPPKELPPEVEERWREAMDNPDYRMYAHLYSILSQRGGRDSYWFNLLLDPYDHEEDILETEKFFDQIDIPFYTGSGWHAYTYK